MIFYDATGAGAEDGSPVRAPNLSSQSFKLSVPMVSLELAMGPITKRWVPRVLTQTEGNGLLFL